MWDEKGASWYPSLGLWSGRRPRVTVLHMLGVVGGMDIFVLGDKSAPGGHEPTKCEPGVTEVGNKQRSAFEIGHGWY